MSIYEISLVIEAGAEKLEYELKLKTEMQYDQAINIATAVVSMLGGKQPPTVQERYPSLFASPETNVSLSEGKKAPEAWELYKEQMIDFANLHNKNLKKKEG